MSAGSEVGGGEELGGIDGGRGGGEGIVERIAAALNGGLVVRIGVRWKVGVDVEKMLPILLAQIFVDTPLSLSPSPRGIFPGCVHILDENIADRRCVLEISPLEAGKVAFVAGPMTRSDSYHLPMPHSVSKFSSTRIWMNALKQVPLEAMVGVRMCQKKEKTRDGEDEDVIKDGGGGGEERVSGRSGGVGSGAGDECSSLFASTAIAGESFNDFALRLFSVEIPSSGESGCVDCKVPCDVFIDLESYVWEHRDTFFDIIRSAPPGTPSMLIVGVDDESGCVIGSAESSGRVYVEEMHRKWFKDIFPRIPLESLRISVVPVVNILPSEWSEDTVFYYHLGEQREKSRSAQSLLVRARGRGVCVLVDDDIGVLLRERLEEEDKAIELSNNEDIESQLVSKLELEDDFSFRFLRRNVFVVSVLLPRDCALTPFTTDVCDHISRRSLAYAPFNNGSEVKHMDGLGIWLRLQPQPVLRTEFHSSSVVRVVWSTTDEGARKLVYFLEDRVDDGVGMLPERSIVATSADDAEKAVMNLQLEAMERGIWQVLVVCDVDGLKQFAESWSSDNVEAMVAVGVDTRDCGRLVRAFQIATSKFDRIVGLFLTDINYSPKKSVVPGTSRAPFPDLRDVAAMFDDVGREACGEVVDVADCVRRWHQGNVGDLKVELPWAVVDKVVESGKRASDLVEHAKENGVALLSDERRTLYSRLEELAAKGEPSLRYMSVISVSRGCGLSTFLRMCAIRLSKKCTVLWAHPHTTMSVRDVADKLCHTLNTHRPLYIFVDGPGSILSHVKLVANELRRSDERLQIVVVSTSFLHSSRFDVKPKIPPSRGAGFNVLSYESEDMDVGSEVGEINIFPFEPYLCDEEVDRVAAALRSVPYEDGSEEKDFMNDVVAEAKDSEVTSFSRHIFTLLLSWSKGKHVRVHGWVEGEVAKLREEVGKPGGLEKWERNKLLACQLLCALGDEKDGEVDEWSRAHRVDLVRIVKAPGKSSPSIRALHPFISRLVLRCCGVDLEKANGVSEPLIRLLNETNALSEETISVDRQRKIVFHVPHHQRFSPLTQHIVADRSTKHLDTLLDTFLATYDPKYKLLLRTRVYVAWAEEAYENSGGGSGSAGGEGEGEKSAVDFANKAVTVAKEAATSFPSDRDVEAHDIVSNLCWCYVNGSRDGVEDFMTRLKELHDTALENGDSKHIFHSKRAAHHWGHRLHVPPDKFDWARLDTLPKPTV